MDLSKVLFLGSHRDGLIGVQVRCLDVARQLGCDCLLSAQYPDKILDKYSAYVCVKPNLVHSQLAWLKRKGVVIWDIIDELPPREHVDIYLASTVMCREIFVSYGRVVVIPHHHCNFANAPNPASIRHPAWIGCRHWLPALRGFKFDCYDVIGMDQQAVVAAHRKIGIGLNFRANRHLHFPDNHGRVLRNFHVAINSGIKLINCIGFGTPSISDDEPAYREIGSDCTIFSTRNKCANWVRELQNNDDLYAQIRNKCLRRATKYHLSTVASKYRQLLHSL
jgi:hypothetical protein